MTRSYTHHEADSRPEDFGAIEGSNTVEMWNNYHNEEVDTLLEWDSVSPI
jgi:hypothetical protein